MSCNVSASLGIVLIARLSPKEIAPVAAVGFAWLDKVLNTDVGTCGEAVWAVHVRISDSL